MAIGPIMGSEYYLLLCPPAVRRQRTPLGNPTRGEKNNVFRQPSRATCRRNYCMLDCSAKKRERAAIPGSRHSYRNSCHVPWLWCRRRQAVILRRARSSQGHPRTYQSARRSCGAGCSRWDEPGQGARQKKNKKKGETCEAKIIRRCFPQLYRQPFTITTLQPSRIP